MMGRGFKFDEKKINIRGNALHEVRSVALYEVHVRTFFPDPRSTRRDSQDANTPSYHNPCTVKAELGQNHLMGNLHSTVLHPPLKSSGSDETSGIEGGYLPGIMIISCRGVTGYQHRDGRYEYYYPFFALKHVFPAAAQDVALDLAKNDLRRSFRGAMGMGSM